MSETPENRVLVIGAGTMGAGIAQVAAAGGWDVALQDVDVDTVTRAIASVRGRFDRLVEKGRMTADDAAAAGARLCVATPGDAGQCALVIEAIVEDLDVKCAVLTPLVRHLPPEAIVATNTSSLSVTAIGAAIGLADRTVGMHFFNPAPLLPLVEVIAGAGSDPACVTRVAAIAKSWGKKVARAADVPGFIVNHVARPYYLEAFRIIEDGHADAAAIDEAMRELGGFRMGPLELTDLIGQDVNTATTRSVWEQLDRPPLLAPSRVQEQLVADGHLGRKTGRGAYDYTGGTPACVLTPTGVASPVPTGVKIAVAAFVRGATDETGTDLQAYIFARILAALITQAAHAEARAVATATDIDIALRYGTNYPRGPLAWADSIGIETVVELLDALNGTVSDNRFAPPPTLAAASAAGGR
ncbi:MAG: 3-hydroxybutyryl-CoA dehydrogenase [Phycisphaerae bacterium]|nr:3-hydroxybutyryl-CoA dehydrogenase [Phycisphaerae bacterium]